MLSSALFLSVCVIQVISVCFLCWWPIDLSKIFNNITVKDIPKSFKLYMTFIWFTFFGFVQFFGHDLCSESFVMFSKEFHDIFRVIK